MFECKISLKNKDKGYLILSPERQWCRTLNHLPLDCSRIVIISWHIFATYPRILVARNHIEQGIVTLNDLVLIRKYHQHGHTWSWNRKNH